MEKSNKTTRVKKTNKPYSSKFLKRNTMKGRGDKIIYVRPEYHNKLTHIVKIIGADEIPLYALLDNILKHHFDLFSQEISKEYNQNFKRIF